MDKQNNSNLDALLNNLIENFGEDDPVTQKVESLILCAVMGIMAVTACFVQGYNLFDLLKKHFV